MQLMTKKEAAEFLKVSEPTIDNYVKRGLLVPLRAESSHLVRFNSEDVEKFFAPKTPDLLPINKPQE